MTSRRTLVLALAAAFASMGASYRTQNFMVQAPTPQIAEQVGQWAEHYRKEKALQWLGQEMPRWPEPCPLVVQVTMEGPSGETTFAFGSHGVAGQHMTIRGPLERLLASVLPHEITHTVFAYYFQRPVPRWADEGGAVLSEDDLERDRHDKLTRQILNHGREIRLRHLLALTNYPPGQIECLYAEGFSMANYLVERGNRQTFLKFVAYGMQHGWDGAAQTFYQHRNVEELEEAWLKHLRDTKGQSLMQLAQNKAGSTAPAEGTVVRLTVPPVQPLAAAPVVRGQAPAPGEQAQRFGNSPGPAARPGYLPDYNPPALPPGPSGWQPNPTQQPSAPIQVQLGPPQFGPAPAAPRGEPLPGPVSPVGFPR